MDQTLISPKPPRNAELGAAKGADEGGIFDDGTGGTNSDVVCNITGHGEFVNNGSHVLSWAYFVGHPGTDICFEGLSVRSDPKNCIHCFGGKSRLVLQRIKSNGPRAVEMYGGENRLLAQEIIATGNIALDMSGGNNVAAVDTIINTGGLAVHCHWARMIWPRD
jgi:hypothetical protein